MLINGKSNCQSDNALKTESGEVFVHFKNAARNQRSLCGFLK
jgi:hypothetical protein